MTCSTERPNTCLAAIVVNRTPVQVIEIGQSKRANIRLRVLVDELGQSVVVVPVAGVHGDGADAIAMDGQESPKTVALFHRVSLLQIAEAEKWYVAGQPTNCRIAAQEIVFESAKVTSSKFGCLAVWFATR